MFQWFKNRRRKAQREIFQFWDGRRDRRADPLATWRGYLTHKTFNLQIHPALVESGDVEAIGVVAAATRDVFGVPSFEDGGLTEQECLELTVQFFSWIDEVKKNTRILPTSRPLTEPQTSDTSSGSKSADSPSTSSVPSSEPPGGS